MLCVCRVIDCERENFPVVYGIFETSKDKKELTNRNIIVDDVYPTQSLCIQHNLS
jgi:hypothetical protein